MSDFNKVFSATFQRCLDEHADRKANDPSYIKVDRTLKGERPSRGPHQTMMSSVEIAELTGREHSNVARDIRQTLVELYGDEHVEKMIPDHLRNRRSEFIRQNASAIIDAIFPTKSGDSNWNDPGLGFRWVRDARGYVSRYELDQAHTYTLVTGYSAKMRKRIVDRWMELEGRVRRPSHEERLRRAFTEDELGAVGGVVKAVMKKRLEAFEAELDAVLDEKIATRVAELLPKPAPEMVSVRQMLDELGVSRGTRGRLGTHLSKGLHDRAKFIASRGEAYPAVQCAHSHHWLFERSFADAYVKDVAGPMISAHKRKARTGQGVIDFPLTDPKARM